VPWIARRRASKLASGRRITTQAQDRGIAEQIAQERLHGIHDRPPRLNRMMAIFTACPHDVGFQGA
jgi:hypothetical protein